MIPLRGLWKKQPPEGEKFVSVEIDWLTPGVLNCVQFQLAGNSPVVLSQIVCLYVDNARCGSDVTFLFGDSGFVLVVPAYAEGLYPVLTNALMFYASAPKSALGDVTVVQILNSIPPPIAVQLGTQQQSAYVSGISLIANGATQLVPATVNGTLNGFTISVSLVGGAGGGAVNIGLVSGGGGTLWYQNFIAGASQTVNQTIPVTNLRLRFTSGLVASVEGSTGLTGGNAVINVYYSVP